MKETAQLMAALFLLTYVDRDFNEARHLKLIKWFGRLDLETRSKILAVAKRLTDELLLEKDGIDELREDLPAMQEDKINNHGLRF